MKKLFLWCSLLSPLPLLPVFAQEPVNAPFRLVSEARHRELVSLIPPTDDPRIEKLKRDLHVIVYTKATMPSASQFWDQNSLAGVHRADHNISGNPQRQIDGSVSGGPGQEFPWKAPFGMDQVSSAISFKFLWLPRSRAIRWYRERLPRDTRMAYRWSYPVGTVVGEVLLIWDDPTGHHRAFELRIRRKVGYNNWRPDVFRPVRSRMELDRLAPEVADQNERRLLTLRNPHPELFLHLEATEDVLPPLPRGRVRELLSRTFRSVRGYEWTAGGHAPTTHTDFHIVPKDYAGAAVKVTMASCAKCHQTTLNHPDDFGPPGRDWYGRVPGDDQLFSFHPFDPASVSSNGFPQPVRLNQRMVEAGILKHWDEP